MGEISNISFVIGNASFSQDHPTDGEEGNNSDEVLGDFGNIAHRASCLHALGRLMVFISLPATFPVVKVDQ